MVKVIINILLGKAVEMLAIRVTAAIILGALLVWSQTPEANRGKKAPETVTVILDRLDGSETNPSQFTLKLARPHYVTPELQEFTLAENSVPSFTAEPSQSSTSRPKALSISSGFSTRRKIHKYASYATLPLLAAEGAVGQKLLDSTGSESGSLRSAHSALAAGIGVLFGVETVTGLWNMMELRKVSKGNNKRFFHGILMLAADVGFIATAATSPHREEEDLRTGSDASTHKAVAYTSLGIAAFSYVYMLVAK
jgi:hypothetical protein